MKIAAITLSLVLVMLTHSVAAQSLPSKIRGYKVYDAKVYVNNSATPFSKKDGSDAAVRILDPTIIDISFAGAVLEIGAEITALNQSGRVDFMTCRDLRVNGVPIEIEEYTHPFFIKEGEKIALPKPATISIKTANIAKAAYKELVDPKKDWAVTGTVLVFGKFRRFGFSFKRVIPVKVDLTIRNPLTPSPLDPR